MTAEREPGTLVIVRAIERKLDRTVRMLGEFSEYISSRRFAPNMHLVKQC